MPVEETCPYSAPPFGEFTNDHIFPEFLGGRRTIRVCRDCNNRFGHSFEAKAAEQIGRMQVFISHFGLNVTRTSATWPSGLEIDGVKYDLKSGPTGVQYELAQPIILRDEAGEIIGARARSVSEGEQIMGGLVRKGKIKDYKIEESPGEVFKDRKLNVNLSYYGDMYRLSAKIVGNAAVAMGCGELLKLSVFGRYLHGDQVLAPTLATCDTTAIRGIRPPLSHTVYKVMPSYFCLGKCRSTSLFRRVTGEPFWAFSIQFQVKRVLAKSIR